MLLRLLLLLLAVQPVAPVTRAATPIDPPADLYQRAQLNMLEGRQEAAIEKFRVIVRSHPKSPLAPKAQLHIADLFSRNREYATAFEAAQILINKFPASDLFSEALEIQFTVAERVAEEYRRRRMKRDKSTKGLPDREIASQMFRLILANGAFSQVAPRAQYRLAVALDEEGQPSEATREFYVFLENYGDNALADDAAFQIGFVDYRISRENNRERGAQERARLAFEYFLARYPDSEKAPEARHLMGLLQGWESNRLLEAGKFYERTGRQDPALKSYRDALNEAPGTREADAARSKIEKLNGFNASPPASPAR